eukprot:jgi/Psemu1/47823/gm1.47823_g
MPFKKKRASGKTREANNANATDLGVTGVNPTSGSAEESTGRPSPTRSIPQVNYAEEASDNEEEDIDPETYKEPTPPVATTQKHVRLSIALKTIAQICDCLGNNTRSFWRTVTQVCTEVLHCVDNGTVYTGDGNYSKSGRPLVIAVDSIEAEIIADSIEGGNSIRMSRLIQGSKNKTDAWCQASFRWFAQLLLRFGEIDFSHPIFQKLLGPAYVKEKSPPCYDTSLLTPLKHSQVVWFDELHKQCHIGESGSRVGPGKPNVAISFKRNANGKLGLNGSYPEKGKTFLQVKYGQQARFNFGVYMSKDGKGHQVQPPFEYTGNKLITRVERNKLQPQAIALSGNTSQIRTIVGSVSGISFGRLSAFVCAAEACLEGSPPPVVDHRLASYPYLSLHREDSWEEQCGKDCRTGKMCVTEMIDFMFDQTKAILGENGFVYHDTLVLMTSSDSVMYLKEKGYYKSWILPELDLMEECGGVGGALKAYWNRSVGNRPEANPLDTSLLSQLNRAVDQHVILTQDFTDEDKKLSLPTKYDGMVYS